MKGICIDKFYAGYTTVNNTIANQCRLMLNIINIKNIPKYLISEIRVEVLSQRIMK